MRPLEEEGQLAWSACLFNVKKARALEAIISQDQARKMLNDSHKWVGAGWATSKASSVPWNVVGVPLVAVEVTTYKDSWLLALAMVHNVAVGGVALPERASEAEFALSSLISQPEEWQNKPLAAPTNSHHAKEEEEKPEDSIDAMDWDEPEEPLPAELTFFGQ